ncbi:hypothetical protein PRK78_007410 [Emydomyces testavorans]|uniref:Rhodopsin domain-containing protein n=1 Tax=Emydomyces testavorans TaxID=2070801 RepID=A0AAF0DRZ3_9EURO|nr:hypothetical protein PRK78_007410 [Emydomyces testavorans]
MSVSRSTEAPPDGDFNRGQTIDIIMWIEFGVALVLLLLRIFTRTRLIRFWGWDDAFMCLALVHAGVNSALLNVSIRNGTGRHQFYLSSEEVIQANKFNWISHGFHVMSTNWGKVSVALFLLRVVNRAKEQKKAFYGGMVLLTIINVICVFSIYGQCTPTAALWNPWIEGKCWDPHIQRDYAFFQGSFTDLVLAAYPLFIIWKLRMAMKLKIGLGCLMGLGIIAMIAAIVKTIFLAKLTARADYSFNTVSLAIWIATEQYLIIIAACIPTLGPLVKTLVGQASACCQKRHKPSYTRSRPKYGRHRDPHSGNKGQTGMTILTETKTQIYPLSEYKGWVGPTVCSRREGSQDTIFRSDNMTEGVIMKTMEIHVNSAPEEERSDSGTSFQGGSCPV